MLAIFGCFTGLLLSGAGLLTYYLAPKVGPNPFFGVRTGYSFANREVWDRSNRFGGQLLVGLGVVIALVSLLLHLLGLAETTALILWTGFLLLSLLGCTVWIYLHSRNLARGTKLVRQLKPLPFRWHYLSPVAVTLALLLALSAYFYPQLPADRLATHFDMSGVPDGWMSRGAFFATFLGLALAISSLQLVFVWMATREPIISIARLGEHRWLDPGKGLMFIGMALALANLISALVMWDIGWYNLRKAHPLPMGVMILLPLLLIPALLLGFVFLMRPGPETGDDDA